MFSKKWLLRALASVVLGITVLAPCLMAYDDIPGDSPYFYAIEYLRKNDVFQGTKLFKPDSIVTKAEFISYLVKLNSPKFKKEAKVKLPFKDTVNSAWYAPYLAEAVRVGIMTGNEGIINPDQPISVVDALTLLFHSRSIPIPRRYVGAVSYTDLQRSEYAKAMVMRSIELGIVTPQRDDWFGLYRKMTRAETALMIYKMDLVDLRDPDAGLGSAATDSQLAKVNNAWKILLSGYVGKDTLDKSKLADAAIKGMVDTLGDPYSVFMDENQNQAFSDEIGGQFEGIGAYIELKDNKDIAIVSPIKDSPAFKAGIKAGDIIRKVDDFDTKGASLVDVVTHIKGPKGTTVRMTLERDGQTVILDVVRDVVVVKSLEYEVVGNGKYMHIHLISFNENLLNDFKDVVDIVLGNPDIKGLVLDVRDDPGGLLDAAVGVLGYLLPNNSVAVNIQSNFYNYSQNTQGAGELSKYPMAILVNKGSASASEIVAGALKDYGAATVIGETTFGKWTVQEVNYFSDGSSIKLTIAKWLTPQLHSIQKNGITPDIAVTAGTDGSDPQMDRAIEELNRKVH
jgi:carboxyl-terminal processing protease